MFPHCVPLVISVWARGYDFALYEAPAPPVPSVTARAMATTETSAQGRARLILRLTMKTEPPRSFRAGPGLGPSGQTLCRAPTTGIGIWRTRRAGKYARTSRELPVALPVRHRSKSRGFPPAGGRARRAQPGSLPADGNERHTTYDARH